MRHKKIAIIFMVLIVFHIIGCRCDVESQTFPIKIENPKQVRSIQFHTIRLDKKEYPSDKFENLIKDLESVVLVGTEKEKKIAVNDDKIYISLIYEDGTKDIFVFFQENGEWYLEREKRIYANADFLSKYIEEDIYKTLYEEDSMLNTVSESSINLSMEYLEQYLEMTEDLDQVDIETYFRFSVRYLQSQGYAKEDAISKEKEIFIQKWQMYKEAERLALIPSDRELDQFMSEWVSQILKATNLKEYELLLEEYDTSWEELIKKSKNIFYYLDVTNQLYNFTLYRLKYDEFAAGKDTVDGVVYDNVSDYYHAYLENEVYSYQLTDEESKQFLLKIQLNN